MPEALKLAAELGQIGWINVLLSVDNAIMIALACRSLPPRQSRIAMALGAAGAVAMRVVFSLLALRLLDMPGLRLAGGLCVVYLASRLPCQNSEEPDPTASRTLSGAVVAIMVTDATLSLDNALALAAAARGSMALIVFGLVLSMPLIVFGARLMSSLVARLPILVWLGATVLGWAGGQLVAGDTLWSILSMPGPPEIISGLVGSALVLAAAGAASQRTVTA